MLTIKSYRPGRIYLIFEKAENIPRSLRDPNEDFIIKCSISESPEIEV